MNKKTSNLAFAAILGKELNPSPECLLPLPKYLLVYELSLQSMRVIEAVSFMFDGKLKLLLPWQSV